MKTNFPCPHCQQLVSVPHTPGAMVSCPMCNMMFALPQMQVTANYPQYQASLHRRGIPAGIIVGIVLGSAALIGLVVVSLMVVGDAAQHQMEIVHDPNPPDEALVTGAEVRVTPQKAKSRPRNVNKYPFRRNYTAVWNYLMTKIKPDHVLTLKGVYDVKVTRKATVTTVDGGPRISDTDYVISGRQALDKLKYFRKAHPDRKWRLQQKKEGTILRAEWTVKIGNRSIQQTQKQYFLIINGKVAKELKGRATNWSKKRR